jgi:putative oxidoreductase
MAWLTILTELMGGIALLLGLFVTVVSVPLAVVLLVAIFLPFICRMDSARSSS